MPLVLLLDIKEQRPPDVTVRQWPQILRAAHAEVGRYYHDHLLPRHFKGGAEFRYGYKPRSPAYRQRKAKLGKTEPLTFTGTLQRSLVEHANIRGYPSRFSVTMHGPSYIPKRPRSTKQPRLYEEVTSTRPEEQQELAAVLKANIARRIREATT